MTIPDTRPAPGRHRAPDVVPSPAPWMPQQGPRSLQSGGGPTPMPTPMPAPMPSPMPARTPTPPPRGHHRPAVSGPVMAPMRVVPSVPPYGHPMPSGPMPRVGYPAPPHPAPRDTGPTYAATTPAGPTPAGHDAPRPGDPTPGPTPGDPTSREKRERKTWPWVVGALGLLVLGATIGWSGETTPPAPATAATGDTASSSGTVAFGRQAEAGDVTVTAQAPQQRSQALLGTQYCSSVTLTNNGSSTEAFSPFDWKFRTSAGVETTAGIPFSADQSLASGTLRPGGTVSGEVCTDTETTGVTDVVYSPGFGILHEVTFAR